MYKYIVGTLYDSQVTEQNEPSARIVDWQWFLCPYPSFSHQVHDTCASENFQNHQSTKMSTLETNWTLTNGQTNK